MDKKAATKKTAAKAPASKTAAAKPAAKSAAATKPHATTSSSSAPPSAKPHAPAADAPPPMTPKTPKPAAAAPLTPKTPKPPQTPKAPQTPKTPKPPQTPKAAKPAASKAPAKAAAAKPATAKAVPAKPAASTAPVKSASAKTGLVKSASAKAAAKPASAKAAAKPASAKPATDAHAAPAANGTAHDTTAHANGTHANGTHPPENKTPRGDKPASAAPPSRPATTATAKAAAKPAAASGLKRPATSYAASAKGKKATTPRGTTLDTAAANAAAAKGQKATTPRDHSTASKIKKVTKTPLVTPSKTTSHSTNTAAKLVASAKKRALHTAVANSPNKAPKISNSPKTLTKSPSHTTYSPLAGASKRALLEVSNSSPVTSPANRSPPSKKARISSIGSPSGLPKKSPRSPRHPDGGALKSPRHNVAGISRTHTAPELPIPSDLRPSAVTAGSRSVSVGGLQSNITRAAPAGRRKPTTNPLKNRPNSSPMPTREQSNSGRAAAGFFSGMGILAAVGNPGADGLAELSGIQLRKVSEDKPKVLLVHVKGRRNVTARVTEVTHKSLNKGDAFVLVDPSTRRIFEWRGSLANRMEIAKAMDLAGRIKNKEFSGRADMFVLEEGKNDHHEGFWQLLGGKGPIAPAEAVGEDEDEDKQVRHDTLYGVVEKAAGKPELSVVGKHKLSKEMIQSGQVYLVDCLTELYMWVGKGCSNTHRTYVASKAQEHLTSVKTRPKWVIITRVIEGAEPEIFKEKFTDWPSTLPITMAAVPKGNVAAKVNVKFDVNKMLTPVARVDKVVDDGSGKVEIWRVKDHTKEPVDKEMYGQFFDSESYVILYTYMQKNREMYIIYFWQGKKSSINEKGSSALLTVDLDDSIGGAAVQVRVVQNKEPKHFMKLFKGRIIVHKAYETEDGASAVPETALYQIRGFNIVDGACDVRAVQLTSPSAKYLNTNDLFLLNTPDKQYIWIGVASSKFYQLTEAQLAELGSSIKGSREQIFIREGEEPKEFWENVGEAEYYKTEWKWFPRLFHCSSASGSFQVEEVLEWDQEDLDPGHLNILDTSTEVYLWTGQRANIEDEKKQAMETVLDYTKLHPLRKEMGIVSDVLSVTGRREPFAFKSVFTAWDDSKSLDPNGLNDSIKVEDMLKELSRTYSLAELRNPPKMLDSTKLETYLSDEEFQNVFKMDKTAFGAQPLWKQEQQKKNVGLY